MGKALPAPTCMGAPMQSQEGRKLVCCGGTKAFVDPLHQHRVVLLFDLRKGLAQSLQLQGGLVYSI